MAETLQRDIDSLTLLTLANTGGMTIVGRRSIEGLVDRSAVQRSGAAASSGKGSKGSKL